MYLHYCRGVMLDCVQGMKGQGTYKGERRRTAHDRPEEEEGEACDVVPCRLQETPPQVLSSRRALSFPLQNVRPKPTK
jgi:hypothetical protein